MSHLALEDRVRTLLETQLDSFEKLEIIQAIRRSNDGLSTRDLQSACQFSSEIVEETVGALERTQLIERGPADGRIRLGAASQEVAFAALMELYDQDRTRVLSVLSSAVLRRLRTMAARAFSEAFVNRKR